MIRILVALLLWSPLVAACCHPTRVDRPVVVRPPSCLTRPAPFAPTPLPDERQDAYMMRFARWYALELSSWIVEVEASCAGPEAASEPVEPRWWVGATGTAGTQ